MRRKSWKEGRSGKGQEKKKRRKKSKGNEEEEERREGRKIREGWRKKRERRKKSKGKEEEEERRGGGEILKREGTQKKFNGFLYLYPKNSM